jgi:integrase
VISTAGLIGASIDESSLKASFDLSREGVNAVPLARRIRFHPNGGSTSEIDEEIFTQRIIWLHTERVMAKRSRQKAAHGSGCIIKRGTVYYVKIHLGGGKKPVYRTSRDVARGRDGTKHEHARQLLAEIQGQKHRGEITGTSADRVTCGELMDALLKHYHEMKKKSVRDSEYRVNSTLKPYFGTMLARNVTTQVLEDYRQRRVATAGKRSGTRLSHVTVNRELAHLRAAFNLGAGTTPPKVLQVPKFKMRPEDNARQGFLAREDYDSLIAALPWYLKPLVVTAHWTGVRKGELLEIQWPQIEWSTSTQRGRIVLRTGKTKNGEGRVVPLTADNEAYLSAARRWLDDRGFAEFPYVFFHLGKVAPEHDAACPNQIHSFKEAWTEVVERLNLRTEAGEFLTFHDLRRTAVKHMDESGVSGAVRRAITGHKTDSMDRRYNIVDRNRLMNAGDLIDAYSQRSDKKKVTESATKMGASIALVADLVADDALDALRRN